jgi:hypothetical protein
MGARNKLNASYANGALLIAGAIGVLAGSWPIFAITLGCVLATSFIAGDIRPFGGGKHSHW